MYKIQQKLQHILTINYTESEKAENVQKHKSLHDLGIQFLKRSFQSKEKEFENRVLACECFNRIVSSVDCKEYLLIDAQPFVTKDTLLNSAMNLGNYLKTIGEEFIQTKVSELHKNNATRENKIPLELSDMDKLIFDKALMTFINILQVDFENVDAIKQIVSIYTQLTYMNQENKEIALRHLNDALLFDPVNPIIHYNLGHMYQRINQLEKSIVHYKLSIQLNKLSDEQDTKQLDINNFNGIASIYRSIKRWPESLHYLLKAHKIDTEDPDINNQLGVVYTELRNTNIAEKHYRLAIQHHKKTFVSTDPTFLLSEIYLNYGHMHSYNGDNMKSIECYNQSLKIVNNFVLPYQNKMMNLCYVFNELPEDDKLYITRQHKLINKLYVKNPNPYIFDTNYYNTRKINVAIISGDFCNHPVSFFISTYLKNFDHTKFNVTCYSESIIDTTLFNKNLQFKLIKNMSQKVASELIYNDQIHILLDLAGNTSNNRLDVFAYKPAPIQISYIGYAFSTGLEEMDFRIVDNITDGDLSISQKFYTEKLIALPDAFMCYDYHGSDERQNKLPNITETPRLKNHGELIIGCFNRVNKITNTVIVEFNKILLAHNNVKMLFKTKSLINLKIREEFVKKFDKKVRNRLIIIPCTLTHNLHLDTYNQVDIAIDTWPYSGTTTSCEALMMGCGVLSLYDSKYQLHSQNVTCSILRNSDLDFYVCNNTQEIIDKIKILLDNPKDFWKTLKIDVRNKFLNGKFTNKNLYMKNIQKLFTDLYNKHKV